MSAEKLNKLYQELREELDSLETSDEESRRKLLQLAIDIEERLAAQGEKIDDNVLQDSIGDTVLRIEVEHPRAAGILNQIMMTLANMGI